MTLSQNFLLSRKTEPTCPFPAKICHCSRFPAANRKRWFSPGTGTRPFQREGLPTFPRNSFCSFWRGSPSILRPASGPSRAAQPGHLLLPRLSGPRPRGAGRARAGPAAVLRPPREGRGGPAPAVRSVRAESPAALGAPAGGSRDPARVHVDRVKCPTLP